MKTGKTLFACLLALLAMALVFTTCDLSLGSMVNTEKPKIGTEGEDSTPGAFLQTHRCTPACNPNPCELSDKNRLTLDVEQPFGLQEVFVTVAYFVWEMNDKGELVKVRKDGKFPAKFDSVSGKWYADLPTGEWADGRIVATVTAIDISGNVVTTTDMIYNIKNTPPQIELSIPKIKGMGFDSATLNQGKGDEPSDLEMNKIYVGTDLMGTAFDEKGMDVGYPKIMIWPAEGNIHYSGNPIVVDHTTKLPVKTDPATGLPSEKDGDYLDETWGKWHTVVDANYKRLNMDPLDTVTAMQFRWPLIDLSHPNFFYRTDGSLPESSYFEYLKPGAYNVMIITRDSFAKPNYNYYPNRTDRPDKLSPQENTIKFMTIKITAATNPQVRIRETPAYHNPDRDYVGTISIEMPVAGTSPQAIRTRFSNIDDTDLIRDTDNTDLALNIEDHPNANITYDYDDQRNIYTIRIKSDKVKADLEGGNPSGTKYWLIRVDGSDDQTGVTRQPVVFDSQAPYINFIQPQGLSATNSPTVTSSVTIRGSTLDNQIVHSMYYVLGQTETKKIESLQSDMATAAHPLNDDYTGWINTGLGDNDCLPTCAVNCPNHLPLTSHPGNGIDPLPAGIPIRATWMPDPANVGILPAWTWVFADIYDFCVGLNSETRPGEPANYYITVNDRGAELWNLPIWYKIVDMAGNINVVKTTLILDPNADMPETVINSPTEGAIVGGQVRVSGLGSDNEHIHSMEVRVSIREYDNPNTITGWYIGNETTWVPIDQYKVNDEAKGSVGARGSTVSWFINLNTETNEPLTPKKDTNGVIIGDSLKRVVVEVRARDAYLSTSETIKPKPGNPESLTLLFSPDVPRIGDPTIIKNSWVNYNNTSITPDKTKVEEAYGFGDNKVSNTIVLKVPFETVADLESIRVSIGSWLECKTRTTEPTVANDNDPYYAWIKHESGTPGTLLDNKLTGGKDNKYTLYVQVNTNLVNDKTYTWEATGTPPVSGTPNIFQIQVDCQDNSDNKFKANSVFQLQVDNFYPMAAYEGYLTAKGNFEIIGKTWDSSVGKTRVGNVERLVVFFAKDDGTKGGFGTFVNLSNGKSDIDNVPDGSFANSSFKVRQNRKGSTPGDTQSTISSEGTTPAIFNYFPNGVDTGTVDTITGKPIWKSNNYGIVVDDNSNSIPLPSFISSIEFTSGITRTWSIKYDSTKLPDGKYKMHYIAIDHAMNATHYMEDIYVANNRPEIRNITLSTDYNANTTIEPATESMRYPPTGNLVGYNDNRYKEHRPEFRVMNEKLQLNMSIVSGNNQKRYRVYYATRALGSGIVVGYTYTIIEPGKIQWFNYGAPEAHVTLDNYKGVTFYATRAIAAADLTAAGATVWRYDIQGTDTLAEDTFTNNTIPEANGDVINTAADIQFGFTGKNPDAFKSGGIPDSVGVTIDISTGKIIWSKDNNNGRYILLHVFDATVGTYPTVDLDESEWRAYRANQLSHLALINIGITNTDSMAPVVDIAPIGKRYEQAEGSSSNMANYRDRVAKNLPATVAGYNENVVTDANGKRMGYVQYAADKEDADDDTLPDTSGIVIFKGKAMDNNRIAKIEATIPGYNDDDPFVIANTISNVFGPSPQTNTIGAMSSGSKDWGFEVTNVSNSGEYGNVINWNFAWDTSKHSDVVITGAEITFTVYDGENKSTQTATIKTKFDIVPYISEVKTGLSSAYRNNPSTFNRSATGWYPVREGEVINVMGFNFKSDATATINGESATVAYVDTRQVNVTVSTAMTSGELILTSGGVDALNNGNNKDAHYNKEPNGVNNDSLTDDRNLYVWRVGDFYTAGTTAAIQTTSGTGKDFPYLNPVFRMDSSSNWYLSFGGAATNTGFLYVSKNGTARSVHGNSNRWRHTTVAYDSNGNTYAIGADQTYNSQNWLFGYRMNATSNTAAFSTSSAGLNAHTATNALASAGGDRFQLPRIAARSSSANAARVLISYFDTMSDYVQGTGAGREKPNQLRLHNATIGTTFSIGNQQIVADETTTSTHKGSMFTAVGFLDTGRSVIAWYDRINQNLVLSYGDTDNTVVGTGTWQSRAKIVHSLAGSHVDMAIDDGNNIHLAYYDSLNGGLYYAWVPSTGTDTTPNVSAAKYVKVDTYLSAGTRIMLNVRKEGSNNVPYISYFHASFDETKFSVRVAWPKHVINSTNAPKPGSDENDKLTGDWEVMTVPANNTPASGQYVCNGVPTSGNISGSSSTSFNGTTNGVVSKTIFVGYMTDKNYEGAYLKEDLY